jgi:hypothetical protein
MTSRNPDQVSGQVTQGFLEPVGRMNQRDAVAILDTELLWQGSSGVASHRSSPLVRIQ